MAIVMTTRKIDGFIDRKTEVERGKKVETVRDRKIEAVKGRKIIIWL